MIKAPLNGFLVGIIFLFCLTFVLAQTSSQAQATCNAVGQIDYQINQYCDSNLEWKNLKESGISCVNNYECKIQSCKEGICKSEFEGIQETLKWYEKIWELIQFWDGIPDITPGECIEEGDTIVVGPADLDCCEGLIELSVFIYDSSTGQCIPQEGNDICTNCGDDVCGTGESYCNCPTDCTENCGDGICDEGEQEICILDCILPNECNDNEICDSGENYLTCEDCLEDGCGDGICVQEESLESLIPENYCEEDCAVGCDNDGVCESFKNETSENCLTDCTNEIICGDYVCEGNESCSTCSSDCGSCGGPQFCGDGYCNGNEDCVSCNDDCGNCPNQVGSGGSSHRTIIDDPVTSCGDDICDLDETCSVCSEDCGQCPISLTSDEAFCGDGWCANDEDFDSCPDDCSNVQKSLWWLWLILIILILGVLAFIGYVIYKKKTASGNFGNAGVSGKELPKYPPKSEVSIEAKPKPVLERPKLIIPEVSSKAVRQL